MMKSEKKTYLVGTSGWSYPHWKGVFYHEDWPRSRWFEYYARSFSTVEINATFYRNFKESTYRKWYDQSSEQFLYVLKAPRVITHRKTLQHVEKDIETFWKSASFLKEKFGLILLQLSPSIPYDLERLKHALLAFKDPGQVAVEFRNQDWITSEMKDLLVKTGSIYCNADSPGSRLLDWVTSETGYVRLHGRKQWYGSDYSDSELLEISRHVKRMAGQGTKAVYIFFNNDFHGYAPKNAQRLDEMLN